MQIRDVDAVVESGIKLSLSFEQLYDLTNLEAVFPVLSSDLVYFPTVLRGFVFNT